MDIIDKRTLLESIRRDEEGYLVDPNSWTKELAYAIADEIGVDLTDVAWKAIEFARDDFNQQGEPPTLRRITKMSGLSTKDIYRLFPKGPASKISKIAGLGKPTGCI